MAIITDRFNPSFVTFPLQNNRTAYQPVNIPLLLVVPFAKTSTGVRVGGSDVSNLKFFIEDAPGLVPVAGFEHAGVFVPDFLRFSLDVSASQLNTVLIDLAPLTFFDKVTGAQKNLSQAVEGDTFEYTLKRGLVEAIGPRDRIEYLPDALYYDLSPFIIETLDLKPLGRYNFSWQCNYFNRVVTQNDEFFCIDDSDVRLARFSIQMAHPGEIHQMMIQQTPTVYFTGQPLDQDSLVKFYRPFADALQDIFDEQSLIVGINWVDRIPAQLLPYLSYLIGWDLPFFPGSTDNIRRSVLRNGRRLQQLKGSRRVINELFKIFGFTIDIVNLWYSKDGAKFIGPGEKQPPKYADQQIDIVPVCQTDILFDSTVNNQNISGFGGADGISSFQVPLMFKATSEVTLDAYYVQAGSTADTQLAALVTTANADPDSLQSASCSLNQLGARVSPALQTGVTGQTVGYSQVLISPQFGPTAETRKGEAPLSVHSVNYNNVTNVVTLGFDHFIDFTDGKFNLYVFATYGRDDIVVPDKIKDLRSNRFDIDILFNRETGETPDSQLLDFLLDFIFKLKAFHSILRAIAFTVTATEVYNVIDFCRGGTVAEAPGTDAGDLQTIPAIIPTIPGSAKPCSEQAVTLGYRPADLALREIILRGLEEEHKAWKNLDGTHNLDPILDSLMRINPNVPDTPPCEFTKYGQDRVIDVDDPCCNKDFDHHPDDRTKLCDATGNTLQNCFKGRVQQDAEIDSVIELTEIFRSRPCELMLGKGFYYTFAPPPHALNTVKYGQQKYGRMTYNEREIDLTKLTNLGLSPLTDALIKMEAFPDTVNFTAHEGLEDSDLTTDTLAIRRPSLEIDKDNLFIPGHRFVVLSKLENDFIHPTYTFRPWDSIFYVCPENRPVGAPTLADLNPYLVEDSEGNERLVFNSIPYELWGNGLLEDISTLGNHDNRPYLVSHSIFSTAPNDTAIDMKTKGGTVFTTDQNVCFGSVSEGSYDILYNSIFRSANQNCGCDNPSISFTPPGATLTQGADFIDGYPAEINRYIFDPADSDYERGLSSDVDLHLILGLPESGVSGGSYPTPADLLFKLGSGIKLEPSEPQYKFYKPHRLDCGCQIFSCSDGTGSSSVPHVNRCLIPDFFDNNGAFDPNTDPLEIDEKMILEESIHPRALALECYPFTAAFGDEEIPNLISFDPLKLVPGGSPPSGKFFFIDPYGVIHDGSFETYGNRIDITVTTKDPRVWGEAPTGYVKDGRVYRKGTITTCRQIVEVVDKVAHIIASGCEQKIDFFQSTFQCGDQRPADPFAYHCDNAVYDGLEIDLKCGPGWPEALGGSFTIFTVWPNLVEDSFGIVHIQTPHGDQPIQWINVWANNEASILQTLCPQGTGEVGSETIGS